MSIWDAFLLPLRPAPSEPQGDSRGTIPKAALLATHWAGSPDLGHQCQQAGGKLPGSVQARSENRLYTFFLGDSQL